VPPASEVVVTFKVAGAIAIDSAAVVVADAESVTLTVKLLVPAAVGVPEIVPFAASVNPAGNVPLASDHVYGGVPPEAAKLWVYAAPTVPGASVDVVTLTGVPATVIESAAVALFKVRSVTRTVKLLVPAAVGVPEIVPVRPRLSPAGSVPLARVHTYGGVPADARTVCE
jgi:hypothetical protein